MDFIDLPSVFRDKSVQSFIPIICYKYSKPIRSAIFNFNKHVSDLDIETCTPDFLDYKDSKYVYPTAGHVITGNLKIISDSQIRSIRAKGPKYRFPAQTDFQKCFENIAASLNVYLVVGVSESMRSVML